MLLFGNRHDRGALRVAAVRESGSHAAIPRAIALLAPALRSDPRRRILKKLARSTAQAMALRCVPRFSTARSLRAPPDLRTRRGFQSVAGRSYSAKSKDLRFWH